MLKESFKKLNLFVLLMSLLFCIKELSSFDIGGIMLVGLITLFTISLSYKQSKAFVFYILPFTISISGLSVLFMYIVLLFKSRRKNIWQFVPPILIALLELFNVLFYIFPINFESVISYISFISLFFFLLFDKTDENGILLCLKTFCFGVALVLLLVYTSMIVQNGFEQLLVGNLRNTIAMGYDDIADAKGKLTINANTIAYYSIVLLSILMLGYRRLSINRLLYIMMLVVAVFAGLFSFSRTWLILSSLILIFYVILSKQKIIIIISGVIICCFLVATQYSILSSVMDVFNDRMNAETMLDAGGRIPIFMDYNKFWSSNISFILFGTGATHYTKVVSHEFSMHCGAQQIWVLHGIFGMIIYLIAVFRYSRKYAIKQKPLLYSIPFFTCLIFNQSIQFLVPYALMMPFVPVAYILQLKDNVCIKK